MASTVARIIADPALEAPDPDIVGYEITRDGWQPMDAVRNAAFIQEGIDSIERGDYLTQEEMAVEFKRMREKYLALCRA